MCDPVPCTLLVSNESLIDGIHVLFNVPLIEVRDKQAKEYKNEVITAFNLSSLH